MEEERREEDTIQNDEKSQCDVVGKDPRCHRRTRQVQTSQVGGKENLVEAEPDIFCYERFKEWASRLPMKKVSEGNQDTKKTKLNPAETIENCHKNPKGIAQEERKNVDCYCCAIVQQNAIFVIAHPQGKGCVVQYKYNM